ncbi:hypothetical protein LTR99_009647 [Exophiala xenobiotica]|uniref:Metallo-beta-lactamase domain-containing protein n=1 Tax=Vermiconidia calcicola TaxID=1690605 RepID=A0AAV9PX84_9PEZI|nr:hypothetical protein LTR92_007774 [Exophiala xenobiotica]KAK5530485.1 hypothetical protein LTR25_009063 [Vermiconidia calcicola]KAK5272117.1 hypothetical protein LTR96_001747 [Exophiala xenobiotica]KAK5294249.1 hypothetical protein LTR99_009647 [Exophiala xenobiotica]KAK5336142.1 hypothetical protein LTR98_007472 [Exophiala xenobiotica]
MAYSSKNVRSVRRLQASIEHLSKDYSGSSLQSPISASPALRTRRSLGSQPFSNLVANQATLRSQQHYLSQLRKVNKTSRRPASTVRHITMEPKVHTLFEPVTGTWQYVVADEATKEAVIIDPVLDYDKATGKVATQSADKILDLVAQCGYTVSRILETHAHADHLTASRYLQNVLAERQPNSARPQVCIGERIRVVQETMSKIYNIPKSDLEAAFDCTFADDDTFPIGTIESKVIYLPGHTPDHIGYIIGSNVFTGDSIFNPDVGSARCDFPGGSAMQLYHSMQKLLSLPGHFRLYTGHDYPPDTRDLPADQHVDGKKAVPFTTVETQRRENKHVRIGTDMKDFVQWRSERDGSLGEPKLLGPSLQVNLRGGRLPVKDSELMRIADVPAAVPRVVKV